MVNTGDTAWILTSAALVLLMTPGLALFYGGMVRAKSVLNMMMMSFGALALISVLWVLYGYSEAFGNDVGAGLVGNPFEFFGLSKLMGTNGVDGGFQSTSLVYTIPSMAFVAFQAVFAIITVALISGAIADRAKFGPWMVFAGIWATIVATQTSEAWPLAASAEPALKPNQPNHSRPAPAMTRVRLCGRIGSRPKPTRLPRTIARARPATPALMCTAVPPAKSIASSLFAIQPPVSDWAPLKAKTQCATGK